MKLFSLIFAVNSPNFESQCLATKCKQNVNSIMIIENATNIFKPIFDLSFVIKLIKRAYLKVGGAYEIRFIFHMFPQLLVSPHKADK